MNLKMSLGLVNDPRLTPELQRTRSGSTQEFRARTKMSFTPDFSIKPPERHIYAEIISNVWHWVNGCDECNGKESRYTYIKCVKHDVCVHCKSPRNECEQPHWGAANGFLCSSCHTINEAERKLAILERINSFEYNEIDFWGEPKITCPYCKEKVDPDSEDYEANDAEVKCHECENTFKLTAEHSVSWTTKRMKAA